VKDQASWWNPAQPEEESVSALLHSRGVRYTNLEGWQRLDAKERELGEARGRERLKLVPREEMLEVSLDGSH
jgi:ferredoxin/flavodoxin---NADP+ reductase